MDVSPAWLAGWRTLYALLQALAPWALSPDPAAPDTPDGLMLRALAGWAGLAALVGLAVSLARRPGRRPWFLWGALALLGGAFAGQWALARASLPLGVAAWALSPLAWATLAGAVHRAAPAPHRAPALAALGVLLAATLAMAWPRLRSVEAMWSYATERSPAHARAWRALASTARARGDRARERSLLDRCASASPRAWECALDRAELALADRDFPRAARDAARALAARPDHPRALTVRALGLARQVPIAPEALDAATRAVERSPRDGGAHLALALALDAAGRPGEARTHAQSALTFGGGADALLLQSLLALREGDAGAARRSAEAALRASPDDARALYHLGLVEQQAGHYNAAREAYLRSLQADRTGYAARYNLAALTHGAGADQEARHHLEVLLRDHPDDPAALALLRQIDGAPQGPAAALRPR